VTGVQTCALPICEIDRISSTRRNQKALDFIYRNAKIIRQSP
jgi:hypothetical protein